MAARLSLAGSVAGAALVLLAASAFADDADRACTRETIGRAPAVHATQLRAAVERIFDREAAPSLETRDGVLADSDAPQLLVVRVKDGKPVIACVDSKDAAVRFLTAPPEKIGSRKAEEK